MAAKTFAAFALCMLAAAHAQSDAAAAPVVVMVDSTSSVVVRARSAAACACACAGGRGMPRGLRGAAATGSRAAARQANQRGLRFEMLRFRCPRRRSAATRRRWSPMRRTPASPWCGLRGGAASDAAHARARLLAPKNVRCACFRPPARRRIGRDLGAAAVRRGKCGVLPRAAGRAAALRRVQPVFRCLLCFCHPALGRL
jgi:hypothetical protein